ncbi:MAG TPA: FAD-binding oxidoreductase [Patescibacteria group bacterium]|nr:FAD-binding oxidoreductase [Patescibacteria group bacterium]
MDVTELGKIVEGRVIGPGDAEFDVSRKVWNARFDRSPDLIVRCLTSSDVAASVRWAVRQDVPLFVKGGGHSYAGTTVGTGGLLLDLSPMSGIKVRAEERRVTVQAGATWAALDSATQHHGLATTGPTVSSVGVAGSTLGGGTGWLSRKFGHSLDNLLAAELVTVEGDVVMASAQAQSELFWGLRGAGHNLGIVTSLEFELHEVGPQVLAGQIIYPFDDAERMLAGYAEFMASAPDELQCLAFTFRVPPIDAFPAELHGEPVLDFVVFHTDPAAVDTVAPLRSLGTAILDAVGPMEYTAVQRSFDANLPAGQRYYSTAHDLHRLSDAAIADFATFVRTSEGAFTASYFEPHGGAVGRVRDSATAMGGRDAGYGFHVIAGWQDPVEDDAVMGWARAFGAAMAAYATGGVYVNLIAEDQQHRIPSAFSDPARVAHLKRAWDPDNVLRGNHNVSPAPA